VVSAGPDQTIYGETSADLAGITDNGTGIWSILEGSGGEIATTKLNGVSGQTYKLKWEASNDCGKTSDEVLIQFKACGTQSISAMVENMHWIEQSCFRIETKN